MAIIKSENKEQSGYTEDFLECYRRARESGYNHEIAKAWCEYLYG